MGRTTIYLPDSYKSLLAARPDINFSEICRKAAASELGMTDTTSLEASIKKHRDILRVLKEQLDAHKKKIAEPSSKLRVWLFKAGAISRAAILKNGFNSELISILVQRGELMFSEEKQGLMLTAKGREIAKNLELVK